MKDLEGKTYEEQLRLLGLFSLENNGGKPHHSLQLPNEGNRRVRFTSLLSGDEGQE